MRNSQSCLITLPVAFLFCLTCAAWGGEDGTAKTDRDGYGPRTEQEKADADLIRQEDEREQEKTGEAVLTTLEGKLYLLREINEKALPWVVGQFVVKGRVHGLLLDNPELFNQLKTLNMKTLKLSGRLRLNGKYFIATSVYVALRVPSNAPKRGGM